MSRRKYVIRMCFTSLTLLSFNNDVLKNVLAERTFFSLWFSFRANWSVNLRFALQNDFIVAIQQSPLRIDANCYSLTTRVGVRRFRQNENLRLGWIFVSVLSILSCLTLF